MLRNVQCDAAPVCKPAFSGRLAAHAFISYATKDEATTVQGRRGRAEASWAFAQVLNVPLPLWNNRGRCSLVSVLFAAMYLKNVHYNDLIAKCIMPKCSCL